MGTANTAASAHRMPMAELARHDAKVGALAATLLEPQTLEELEPKVCGMIARAIAGDAVSADLLLSLLLCDDAELEKKLATALAKHNEVACNAPSTSSSLITTNN